MTRSIFNIIISVDLHELITDKQDYYDKANMIASAMHDVLATRESLSDLTNNTLLTVSHAECDIELEENTLSGTALVDIEADYTVLLNKPIMTKLFRARLASLGHVKIEKRTVEIPFQY
jgi:hypothetical protein